jgi:MFS transporter, AAHS family, 4-hydroxybenzoate transporter
MNARTAAPHVLDVEEVLARGNRPGFQAMLLLLCGLCLVIDGFDAQAISYVAPAIVAEWHVPKTALGPVFSSGFLGLLLGALSLSVLADRVGRRPVLIGTTLFFTVAILATPFAKTIPALIAIRFVTGIGLGCIMPGAMALIGEFSSPDRRIKRMMWISCGFTLGAALGGFLSAMLIPTSGWRSVFWLGGIAPLLLAIAMFFLLPESLQFLLVKGENDRARRWLKQYDPTLEVTEQTKLVARDVAAKGVPVAELFRRGRTPITLLLWAISFLNLVVMAFLSNWLPTLMRDAGYPVGIAVITGTLLQLGGVTGTLILGGLIQRFGFVRVLFAAFVIAALAVSAIGVTQHALPWLLATVFCGGFCVVGGQPAVNALAGHYYPTALRSTGIGWSLGVGRLGAMTGPLVGGQLLALNSSTTVLFNAAAVPALCSAMLVLFLAAATRGGERNGVLVAQAASENRSIR